MNSGRHALSAVPRTAESPALQSVQRALELESVRAGDDTAAKQTVTSLLQDLGFETVDAGPLKNARLLEPLGYLNIPLGYVLGFGPHIGLKLVKA